MAISQITTSNTFQQWLTSTQLLIEHANYFQNTTNLVFESANNVTNTNTFIQSYVSSAYDTANTVNTIANFANTTANIANTTAYNANAIANIANTTAYNANTVATQILSDITTGNVTLEVINDTTRNANLNVALFEVSSGLTSNVYASASKLNFNPSTGALSSIEYKVNGVTVIDSGRNLVNLGSAIAVANGGTGATTSANARINLGVAIGTDVQAYSATLNTVSNGTYTGATSITTLGTISTGTWSASTIAVNRGGTGLTVYAAGDILYASGTATLAKVAGAATGSALLSGGTSGAPAWGKVGLTTHVSGILSVANGGTGGTLPVANGGTGGTTSSAARTNLGLAIGTDVQAYSANLAAFALKTAPSGTVVGTTDTQTVNSKTMYSTTLHGVTLNDGYTEEVFTVTGTTPALSPANGSIQVWTLTGSSTPTAGTWNSGQSITLMIDDGSARTINWTSVPVTWKTDLGSAPTLNLTGFTVIVLWKVSTTIYGARVGNS